MLHSCRSPAERSLQVDPAFRELAHRDTVSKTASAHRFHGCLRRRNSVSVDSFRSHRVWTHRIGTARFRGQVSSPATRNSCSTLASIAAAIAVADVRHAQRKLRRLTRATVWEGAERARPAKYLEFRFSTLHQYALCQHLYVYSTVPRSQLL